MVEAAGTAADGLAQLPGHQRPHHQQRQGKPAAHQRHTEVERLQHGPGRAHAAGKSSGTHGVARRGRAEGKAGQQQHEHSGFSHAVTPPHQQRPRHQQRVCQQAQKQRGVLGPAHRHGQHKKQRIQRDLRPPPLRAFKAQPHAQPNQRHGPQQRVGHAAVEPEKRLAQFRHKLHHHKRHRAERRPEGLPVRAQRPHQRLPQEEPHRKQQKRQQQGRRHPVEVLAEQRGLKRAQEGRGVGALPGVADAHGVLYGGAYRLQEAPGFAPGIMRADGKTEVVIAGMVVRRQGVQRHQAEQQSRHAQPHQRPVGQAAPGKRMSHGAPSSPAILMASLP